MDKICIPGSSADGDDGWCTTPRIIDNRATASTSASTTIHRSPFGSMASRYNRTAR